METLEKSCMCRLCGKQSGISINIFDKKENHVRKINAILPILVHEMDLLPKQMCHRCSYKLEEFYNFYVECARTDSELKSQLSWMQKEDLEEKIITPMVKMSRFKIKTEPPDADSKDADDVFGQFNEDSLLFPTSLLNHGYFPSSSPMMTCSRCRCLCNTSVKVNKNSPKDSPSSNKSQAHGSNSPNKLSNADILSKAKSVRVNLTKEFADKDNIQEISIKENSSFENRQSFHSDDNDEKSNRALRPRKGSVDYVGPKKKKVNSDFKVKITNKLNLTDPALMNSVDTTKQIKVCTNNSIVTNNHCPIIKLEKVDETMKMLRAKKNLEEFNKRIREFQRDKKSKGECGKKNSFKEEKHLKRKSLFSEGIFNKNSLLKEEHKKKRTVPKDQHVKKKASEVTTATGENSIESDLQNESHSKDKQYLSSIVKCDLSASAITVSESQMKEEEVKFSENYESLAKQTVKEQFSGVEAANAKKDVKTIDKISLCSVVKLEKDYTCNVDYPRIKIKRHLPSPSTVLECDLDENGSIVNLTKERKSTKEVTSTDMFAKSSKNKNKCPKEVKHKQKPKALFKKKKKHFDLTKVKRTVLDKDISVIASQTDLKRYCDECDTSFKNKELFNLHPCYQK